MYANKEQELFSVTTKRWLYNEQEQRAVRHVPFNVEAFLDVAIRAVGAKECLSFEKVQDGTFNRVFSLKFDNEVELIAKIPFSVAGPKHFCTASEVATLDYLRTEHGIPVPNVRAWCSKADQTPVGAEYIMYERMPGVPLYHHDRNELPLDDDPYVDIIPVMQRIETRLASTFFSRIGSIYYKEDVHESLRDQPLYHHQRKNNANSARFCIGPTVDREFWRGGRAHLNLDRGPWSDMRSQMQAMAACARTSADAVANEVERDEYHQLILAYEALIPHLAPPGHKPLILWHPDLHANNIIVTEATTPCKLTGIIDWQGTVVGTDYMQACVPPAFVAEEHPLVDCSHEEGPRLIEEYNALDDEDEQKHLASLAYRRAWRQKCHEIQIQTTDEYLAKQFYGPLGFLPKRAMHDPGLALLRGDTEGLPFIRNAFSTCHILWDCLSFGKSESGEVLEPFPWNISKADEERFKEDWAGRRRDASMCDDLLRRLHIPKDRDGIVDIEDYERVKREVDEAKQIALDAAHPEEERDRIARVWPLQDGKGSRLAAEICW